jgi:hypothetical protein
MDFLELKKYSQELNKLDDSVVSKLCSLAFSKREDVLSVAVGTRDKNVFEQVCNKITLPRNFLEGDYIRWGVDLESIQTDKIRIYRVPPKSNTTRVEGFYIDKNGKILEKKLYKKTSEGLSIDRYDSNGKLISFGEAEVECTEKDWTGPKELVEEMKTLGYKFSFMKKIAKKHTYLVVHKHYK